MTMKGSPWTLQAVSVDRVQWWKSSGMTVEEFAAREGVSVNRLCAWSALNARSSAATPLHPIAEAYVVRPCCRMQW